MNREWVLFHLAEAHEELERTIAELRTEREYDYSEYSVAMHHLYHHLNTAWNSRDASAAAVDHATDADFNRWSRFPSDLPMMEV